MNHRNRGLLDLAHELSTCQNCYCFVEGCEPAHQNGIEAGKGQSIKGQDHRHAALCHACHLWYDSGTNRNDPSGLYQPSKAGKSEMWIRAHFKTMDEYWKRGWLAVAA